MSESPALGRLEEQLGWYDTKSQSAQRAYKRVKVAQLIFGATVPVLALTEASSVVTAAVAAFIVVLEGTQQLYQWQTNWVQYRSTAEALKHEKFLYLAHAGPYSKSDRNRILAERVEGLVSQEHAKWAQAREQTDPGGRSGSSDSGHDGAEKGS